MSLDHSITMQPAATPPASRPPWQPSIVAEVARVAANTAVNAEYRHLVVDCSAIAASAQPGQFFQLLCPHPTGEQPFLRRPMSLYGADPVKRQVEFLYKVAGAGTRGLDLIQPGGARRPELLVSVELFKNHGAEVVPVTDSEQTSGPGHVERILRGLIAAGKCDALFTCGSSRLMRVQQRLAVEFRLPGQVAMEQQMACGIGLCYCCVRDFNVGGEIVSRRVCWDGPVFDLLEALP
jgi:dihydroorotate dehydrogenase electron transfer subunit